MTLNDAILAVGIKWPATRAEVKTAVAEKLRTVHPDTAKTSKNVDMVKTFLDARKVLYDAIDRGDNKRHNDYVWDSNKTTTSADFSFMDSVNAFKDFFSHVIGGQVLRKSSEGRYYFISGAYYNPSVLEGINFLDEVAERDPEYIRALLRSLKTLTQEERVAMNTALTRAGYRSKNKIENRDGLYRFTAGTYKSLPVLYVLGKDPAYVAQFYPAASAADRRAIDEVKLSIRGAL